MTMKKHRWGLKKNGSPKKKPGRKKGGRKVARKARKTRKGKKGRKVAKGRHAKGVKHVAKKAKKTVKSSGRKARKTGKKKISHGRHVKNTKRARAQRKAWKLRKARKSYFVALPPGAKLTKKGGVRKRHVYAGSALERYNAAKKAGKGLGGNHRRSGFMDVDSPTLSAHRRSGFMDVDSPTLSEHRRSGYLDVDASPTVRGYSRYVRSGAKLYPTKKDWVKMGGR